MAISAAIILFGSFLGWAVFDRISLKRRADAGAPPIPVGGWGNDLIAVAVGIVAYLALVFAFHPVVIGIPVVGVLTCPFNPPSGARPRRISAPARTASRS